jgi:hypothetical protein
MKPPINLVTVALEKGSTEYQEVANEFQRSSGGNFTIKQVHVQLSIIKRIYLLYI